jgi:hypothetical protein
MDSLSLVEKDGKEVTSTGGLTTPGVISRQDVTFTSLESFNVQEEKIKDMNELMQSCLTVCPSSQ